MNNNFKDKLMEIKPDEEQKARMLSGIKSRMPSSAGRSTKKVVWAAAIAALLCCVFAMTVFADEIAGIFTNNEIVGETVRTSVYCDSDGHIEMSVEEILSDMQTVRMVVLYTALDKQGEEWLAQLSRRGNSTDNGYYDDETGYYGFRISPDYKDSNTRFYGVNLGYGAEEIEEYRTKTQRRFVVDMESDGGNWGTNNIIFYYMMTNYEENRIKRSAVLDVSTNIEKHSFILDNSEAPEKLYKPTEVILSPLSLRILGENLGFFEQGNYETEEGTSYYVRLLEEVDIDSLYLVLVDGQIIDVLNSPLEWNDTVTFGPGAMGHSYSESECSIYSISFKNPIDIDTVAGIELDGVFYSFQ